MNQLTIKGGSAEVLISANGENGPFTSRLYVNNGKTPTLCTNRAKTLNGAVRQAKKMLEAHAS